METQDNRIAAVAAPSATAADYEDFQPFCSWQTTESHHILRLHLHGFKKEQLRVRLSSRGIVSITGERPVEDGTEHPHSRRKQQHRRFCKEIKVSKSSCQSPDDENIIIRARFSAGILTVTLPLEANPRDHHKDQDGIATRISINLENYATTSFCSAAAAVSGYYFFSRLRYWFENLPRLGKVGLVLLAAAILMGLIAALSLSFWISSHHHH